MRWTWLIVLAAAALAAYWFGRPPDRLWQSNADERLIEGKVATMPPTARPDFGEPPAKPPPKK